MYFNKIIRLGILYLITYLFHFANSIMFKLTPKAQRCLREELRQDVLIIGEYDVSEVMQQTVDYVITDSKGHVFSQKEDIRKGKFSFTSENDDMFEICFISKMMENQKGRKNPYGLEKRVHHEINLNVKIGVEAKSYTEIPGADKMTPMEIKLKRVEEFAGAIMDEFEYMLKREEEMSNTNESTRYRVFYLNLFCIFIILALPIWQTIYLKKYFRSKKLID